MALVSFFNDPFVSDMERAMNSMLCTLNAAPRAVAASGPRNAASASALSLPMDIVETGTAYELVADTPGLSPEDLKVELHEGCLTLSGSRTIAREDKAPNGKVWRSERSSYSFSRAFTLPDNVDTDAITATIDKGVLKVTVPKKAPEPKPEPKRITVTGA